MPKNNMRGKKPARRNSANRGDHEGALNHIKTDQLERFLGEQEGINFVSGETDENGAVIYERCRECPIDPADGKSSTPDLAVVYFDRGWKLAFVEIKSGNGALMGQGAGFQKTVAQMYLTKDRITRFFEARGDKRYTPQLIGEIMNHGIGYHLAHSTAHGKLEPLLDTSRPWT